MEYHTEIFLILSPSASGSFSKIYNKEIEACLYVYDKRSESYKFKKLISLRKNTIKETTSIHTKYPNTLYYSTFEHRYYDDIVVKTKDTMLFFPDLESALYSKVILLKDFRDTVVRRIRQLENNFLRRIPEELDEKIKEIKKEYPEKFI